MCGFTLLLFPFYLWFSFFGTKPLSCFSDSCSSLPHMIPFHSCSFVIFYSLGEFFSAAYFVPSSSFVPHSAFSLLLCSSQPGSILSSFHSPHFPVPTAAPQHGHKVGATGTSPFLLSLTPFSFFCLLSPLKRTNLFLFSQNSSWHPFCPIFMTLGVRWMQSCLENGRR